MAFNNTVTETISYDTAADFTFTSTDIEISGSVAQLVGPTYPTTDPAISLASAVGMEAITAFSASSSSSGSDSVTFHISIDGTKKYWDGGAWSTSDGTVAQSNSAADVNTNIAALSALMTGGVSVNVFAVLESDDGSTTPTVTSFTWTYDHFGVVDSISECIVYTHMKDILGDAVSITDATLYATNKKTFKHGNTTIPAFTKTVAFQTIGSDSYVEMSLIETVTPGEEIQFSITYKTGTALKQIIFKPVQVPNQGTAALTDITEPADRDFG